MRQVVVRVPQSHRLAALIALFAATTTLACSSADEEKKSGWDCQRVDVPMGEIVRCTSGPRTGDAPADSTGSLGVRTYGAPPPSDTDSDADAGDAPTAEPPDEAYECPKDSTNPNCPSLGGELGTPPSDGAPAGPDECTEVPDLPYCGGPSSGTTEPPPPDWKCTKDMQGNKVCETAPACAPGAHPSKCGACVLDDEPGECVAPSEGGCWVTGGGFIVEPSIVPAAPADGHDNYGGNAKQMKGGGVQGHWNHVDHGTDNHAKGRPEYLYCRHVDEPGPGQPGGKKGFTMNQVYFGGHAEWRSNGAWSSGYWFDVVAKDHGEPGSVPSPKNGGMVDTYHFTIRKMDDPDARISGPIVYEVKGGLVGGNIQMHPPNNGHPGIQSPLPAWVALEP